MSEAARASLTVTCNGYTRTLALSIGGADEDPTDALTHAIAHCVAEGARVLADDRVAGIVAELGTWPGDARA